MPSVLSVAARRFLHAREYCTLRLESIRVCAEYNSKSNKSCTHFFTFTVINHLPKRTQHHIVNSTKVTATTIIIITTHSSWMKIKRV
jgi:hypothetical protein